MSAGRGIQLWKRSPCKLITSYFVLKRLQHCDMFTDDSKHKTRRANRATESNGIVKQNIIYLFLYQLIWFCL